MILKKNPFLREKKDVGGDHDGRLQAIVMNKFRDSSA